MSQNSSSAAVVVGTLRIKRIVSIEKSGASFIKSDENKLVVDFEGIEHLHS